MDGFHYCALFALMMVMGSSFQVSMDKVSYDSPIRSAMMDEIFDLPGLKEQSLSFRQYSGYLNADDTQSSGKFVHYWFVESQSEPSDDPLVIWLGSGEIGCSNMIGLLAELGPFRVANDLTLELNPHSWNKHANLLFMDSPTGVGYSYRLDKNMYSNDDLIAKQDYLALKSFHNKFPMFRRNAIYLTGRFWAGVQLPLLGLHLDQDEEILNFRGLAIGNGFLDIAKNDAAMLFNGYYHGILNKETWVNLAKSCCFGETLTRSNCLFWPPEDGNCEAAINEATRQIFSSGVNIYNANEPCSADKVAVDCNNDSVTGRLSTHLIGSSLKRNKSAFDISSIDPICNNYESLTNYINQESVRAALHIPKELVSYEPCNSIVTSRYQMIYLFGHGGLTHQIQKLLKSKRKLNLILYSGDADLTCPLIGTRWFVDELSGSTDHHKPWYMNGQIAGFKKQFDQVSFMTIIGAGQMVANDRPAEALELLEKHLLQL